MDISLVFAEAKSESRALCSGGGREGSQIAEQSRAGGLNPAMDVGGWWLCRARWSSDRSPRDAP